MRYAKLIENLDQGRAREQISKTDPLYFESVEKLEEIRRDLSKLDINRHLFGVVKNFLIEWGNMARVVGQQGLNWEGFGQSIQEL